MQKGTLTGARSQCDLLKHMNVYYKKEKLLPVNRNKAYQLLTGLKNSEICFSRHPGESQDPVSQIGFEYRIESGMAFLRFFRSVN